MPRTRSKRYRECMEKVPTETVSLSEAVKVVQGFSPTQFDPTVELVIHLGIDPKQPDQGVRGSISLPHGIGGTRKVIAFCDGEDIAKVQAAGAIEAGGDELIKKIQDGWVDFDVAISTPAMMRSVSKLGRILGPQGKMPSPKSGTVREDIEAAVTEYAAGKIEFRNDEGGNVHAVIGRGSFEPEKLIENIEAFIDRIKRMRPTSSKGTYMKKVALSATMSPAVLVEL